MSNRTEAIDARIQPAPTGGRAWCGRTGMNVASLAAARAVGVVLSLVQVAVLSRALGPESLGILGFGAAMLAYFTIFTRLGFEKLGAREVARDPRSVGLWVDRLLSIQVVLASIGYVLFSATVVFLPANWEFKRIVALQGLALFTQAISLEWAFQGIQRMGILAVRSVGMALVQLAAIVVFVRRPEHAAIAAAAQVGAMVLLNGSLLWSFAREFGPIRWRFEPTVWRRLLRQSASLALGSLLSLFYFQFDLVLLGLFLGEVEVGCFAVGLRAVTASMMAAMVLDQAHFPALSSVSGDLPMMRERARRFAGSMLSLGLPMTIGAAMVAGPLLVAFAGNEFTSGSEAFALLMLTAAASYLSITYGQALIAWNQVRTQVYATGCGALVNIALNFALIPRWGIEGSATASLLATVAATVWLGVAHRRLVGDAHGTLLVRALLAAGLGVVLPVAAGRLVGLPWVANVALGAAGYAIAACACGVVPQEFRIEFISRYRRLVGVAGTRA